MFTHSLITIILIFILYIISFIITGLFTNNGYIDKLSGYECGFEPVGDSRMRFEILYYIIGILYLIFDLEIIFLVPLATIIYELNNLFAFWLINIFFIIVSIGFIYEYIMGAIDIV